MPGSTSESTLIGRADEVAYLADALAAAPPRSVIVAGPAGVGKTSLLRAAAGSARRAGWAVAEVRASRGLANVPGGALRSVLLTEDRPLGSIEEVTASLERSIAELGRQSKGRLLVTVDDAHELDPTSSGLLHHVASSTLATLFLAVSSDGAPPHGDLTSLWKDRLADRLELQPLSRPETAELIAALLGAPVELSSADRVFAVTQGNPLWVTEMALAGRDNGAFARVGGDWRLRGGWARGRRLVEIVRQRLGDLRDGELAALESLAVAGSLPHDALVALSSLDDVQGLEERALVTYERNGRRSEVSIASMLHAEVLLSSMSELRRHEVRRRLIDVTVSAGARREADRVRLACWSMEVGLAADPVTLERASHMSLWHMGDAFVLWLKVLAPLAPDVAPVPPPPGPSAQRAVQLARAAVEAGGGVPSQLRLAWALCWTGQVARATEVIDGLRAAVATTDDRVRVTLALADLRFWGEHDAPVAIAVLHELLESGCEDADPELVAAAWDQLAGIELNCARIREAVPHGERSAALLGIPLAESRAAAPVAACLSGLGRVDEALALIDAAMPAALRRADPMLEIAQLVFGQIGALARAGRLDEAVDLARSCRQIAVASESPEGVAAFGLIAGEIELRRGRARSACEVLRDSAGLLAERDPLGYESWALAGLTRAYVLLGDETAASATLERAERVRRGERHFDSWQYLARSAVHALRGQQAAALTAAEEGIAWTADRGLAVDEALMLDAYVKLGPGRSSLGSAADRLAALAAQVQGALVVQLAAHARALVEHDAEGLLTASDSLAALGCRLLAAEAASEAAAVFDREKRSREFTAATALALRYLEWCEGATTSVVARLRAPARLTSRELEILRLAGGGHTSKDIAERLSLSARTVESHLYRAFGKLGITDRAGIPAALDADRPKMQ